MKTKTVEVGEHRLIHGDCLEALEDIVEPADCMIMDPPYCSGAATEAGRGSATHQGLRSSTMKAGRFKWFASDNMTTAGLCELLRAVCVRAPVHDGGSILSFCDWRMVTMLAPAMESAGWRLRNLIAWDKGHFGAGTGFRPRHELIIHLTKRSPAFFSASVGNVIKVPRVTDRDHPTEKPVELLSRLMDVVCPPGGGVVVDPFMGSGSTGVACAQTGRRFVGIEIDPAHFDTACDRVRNASAGLPLS